MSTTEPTIPMDEAFNYFSYGLPRGGFDGLVSISSDGFSENRLAELKAAIEEALLDPAFTVIYLSTDSMRECDIPNEH